MAYTPTSQLQDPNKEEQQQQQSPSAPAAPSMAGPSLGSTPSVGGTAGNVGSGGLAQQGSGSQPSGQNQAGTGFVNIDKVLSANKDAGKQLNQVARNALTTERHNFNGGFSQVMAGINSQHGSEAYGPADYGFLGADQTKYQENPDYNPNGEGFINGHPVGQKMIPIAGSDDRTAAINDAKGMFKKFQGPTSYDYDIGGSKEAGLLRSLSTPQSIGVSLANMKGPLANYNTGLSAIDQAIYGQKELQPIINSINDDAQGVLQDEVNKSNQVSSAAEAKQKEINASNDQLRAGFQADADRLRSVLGSGYGTEKERSTLNAISQVLNDPTLANVPISAPKPRELPPPMTISTEPPNRAQSFSNGEGLVGDDRAYYQNTRALGWSDAQVLDMMRSHKGLPSAQNASPQQMLANPGLYPMSDEDREKLKKSVENKNKDSSDLIASGRH